MTPRDYSEKAGYRPYSQGAPRSHGGRQGLRWPSAVAKVSSLPDGQLLLQKAADPRQEGGSPSQGRPWRCRTQEGPNVTQPVKGRSRETNPRANGRNKKPGRQDRHTGWPTTSMHCPRRPAPVAPAKILSSGKRAWPPGGSDLATGRGRGPGKIGEKS